MVANDVKRIVFSSTAATYGEPENIPILESDRTCPTNPYGETKLAMEKMFKWTAEAHGMSFVSLRYFNACGADQCGNIGEAHNPESHLIPLVLQVPNRKRAAISIYGTDYDNLEFFDPEKTQVNLEGKKRRKTGKTIILATMYGMGKKSVALKLNITPSEAETMLNAFYDQYVGVKKAIDVSISHCKKYGYVEDILGRKRRLPNIQLPMYQTQFINPPTPKDRSAERLLRCSQFCIHLLKYRVQKTLKASVSHALYK